MNKLSSKFFRKLSSCVQIFRLNGHFAIITRAKKEHSIVYNFVVCSSISFHFNIFSRKMMNNIDVGDQYTVFNWITIHRSTHSNISKAFECRFLLNFFSPVISFLLSLLVLLFFLFLSLSIIESICLFNFYFVRGVILFSIIRKFLFL